MSVQKMIEKLCAELEAVPNIVGIVLGGSRARGTHEPDSDIDIGIYYENSLDIEALNKIATKLDDENRENLITQIGEWGEWINGGGWLVIDEYHVDFIFRDINKVAEVMKDCMKGMVTTHYHTGHPHAYLNMMYMGEISICKILFEKNNRISVLQAKTNPYPKALKDAILNYFLFEANFSLMFAKANVNKDDSSYVMGHCYRIISCLNHVLFAINEEYCINEKKAVRMIEQFAKKPANYKERIDQVVHFISADVESANQAINILAELISETEAIT